MTQKQSKTVPIRVCLAEGFLFAVAAGLIIGESWRGARKDANRRDAVNDRLVELDSKIEGVSSRLDAVLDALESKLEDGRRQNEEMSRILAQVIEIGLSGGWVELQDRPIKVSTGDSSLLLSSQSGIRDETVESAPDAGVSSNPTSPHSASSTSSSSLSSEGKLK